MLKSLMLLAYVMKLAERLRAKQPKMYHRPLLLTLVNSVNTEDADLKRFFRGNLGTLPTFLGGLQCRVQTTTDSIAQPLSS